MARTFDVASLWSDVTSIPEGQVRVTPLMELSGVRVRLLTTRSGSWPKHREDSPELYLVLRGEVAFHTDVEVRVHAGQAIVFAPGEEHGATIEQGAISINVDLA